MDALEEKNKALALANILAIQCNETDFCPAAKVGFPCPFFGYLCGTITQEHWYSCVPNHKKEDLI